VSLLKELREKKERGNAFARFVNLSFFCF